MNLVTSRKEMGVLFNIRFELYVRMISIKNVEKVSEIFSRVGPDNENVIQASEVTIFRAFVASDYHFAIKVLAWFRVNFITMTVPPTYKHHSFLKEKSLGFLA